jgi:hypothetical protein
MQKYIFRVKKPDAESKTLLSQLMVSGLLMCSFSHQGSKAPGRSKAFAKIYFVGLGVTLCLCVLVAMFETLKNQLYFSYLMEYIIIIA